QAIAVLEALDVTGDHAGCGVPREVLDEVGGFEVDLVPGRDPVREAYPELLALHDRASLVSALRHQRDLRAGELAEGLDAVAVGLRPDQGTPGSAGDLPQPGPPPRPLAPHPREARREHHDELATLRSALA